VYAGHCADIVDDSAATIAIKPGALSHVYMFSLNLDGIVTLNGRRSEGEIAPAGSVATLNAEHAETAEQPKRGRFGACGLFGDRLGY
jgi:hypothetical protein